MSALYPDNPANGDIRQQPFLTSNGASLEFSGEAPEASADGTLRYEVGVSVGAPRSLEIRSCWREGGQPAHLSAETLLPRVVSLAVQFWLKPEASPGRWVDHWESNKLPKLIRIDVGFAANDKRRWPPLYIEPRVDTPANCVFDVVSRRCRSGA